MLQKNSLKKTWGFWGGVYLVVLLSLVWGMVTGISPLSERGLGSEAEGEIQTQVYAVSPAVLAVEFETGRVVPAQQQEYRSQWGDSIVTSERGVDWLFRYGRCLGALVGDHHLLYPFDQFIGADLDPDWLDQPQTYELTPLTARDPESGVLEVEAVFRKSLPTDAARVAQWRFRWPMRHTVYLQLSHQLQQWEEYQLAFKESTLPAVTVRLDDSHSVTQAIHLSQIGFQSEAPKVAFLSTWMGTGGGLNYEAGLPFSVLSEERTVYRGRAELSAAATEAEDARGNNYNGADVFSMDFSAVQEPGQYRLCVGRIGCSSTFEIATNTWQRAFYISARGLFHQRSGMELGPPYTEAERSRGFHPDDGVVVTQAGISLMETRMGIGERDVFDALLESRTETPVPEAWGGYFDAGDWDRRIHHMQASRLLLDLLERFPETFAEFELSIPPTEIITPEGEAIILGEDIPDLLQEVLWGMEVFRRLQMPDGGVRGGIESGAHPQYGEHSWQESLPVMVYAPDPWSSYEYAAAAAQLARLLEGFMPQLANIYRESATRAITYAENYVEEVDVVALGRRGHRLRDSRNLAALELYKLTGDSYWHQVFLATTVFKDGSPLPHVWRSHDQREAAFVYSTMPTERVDRNVQNNSQAAVLRGADEALELQQQTGFRWTKQDANAPLRWGDGLGTPKAMSLLRAHALSGEQKYLDSAVLSAQYSLGANPMNLSFTTGLGDRFPLHPLIADTSVSGDPPPPGITLYGPMDFNEYDGDGFLRDKLSPQLTPPLADWPAAESYFDVDRIAPMTEFTIHQTIAPTTYLWGYLSAAEDGH